MSRFKMERDPVSYGREREKETDRMSYCPREGERAFTLGDSGDLGLKDMETSSAAKGDRPKE